MISDVHDIEFSIAQLALAHGAAPRAIVRELQDHWGVPAGPSVRFVKKRSDDDDKPTEPGDHAIPEIARQERAFYDALTEGQRDAYRAVAELVETLYRQGKGWAGVDPWALDEPIEAWKRRAFNALATHPMQAYMLGQMLTGEALGASIARPLVPTDREAIKYLEHQTFNEVGASFDRFKADLRTTLIAGMQTGTNPLQMARDLKRTFKDNERDFSILTITENTRAEAQGRLNELQDADVKWALGSSSHDSNTCDWCATNINGQKIRISAVIGQSNYGRAKADWIPVIPGHPFCRCVYLPYTPETAAIIRQEEVPA